MDSSSLVWGAEFKVYLTFRTLGLEFRGLVLVFKALGLGVWIRAWELGFGFRPCGLGLALRAWTFGFGE